MDIDPQPNYPYEFHQADALKFPLGGFDAIHASPPCQRYSAASKRWNGRAEQHPDLVAPIRRRLVKARVPWVIENVPGAPLIRPVQLCGSSFGLGVRRHRLFEANWDLWGKPCDHDSQPLKYDIYDHGRWYKSPVCHVYGHGGGKSKGDWREAMGGIDWMTLRELAQSIPPAYTEFIGTQLLAHLRGDTATPRYDPFASQITEAA